MADGKWQKIFGVIRASLSRMPGQASSATFGAKDLREERFIKLTVDFQPTRAVRTGLLAACTKEESAPAQAMSH